MNNFLIFIILIKSISLFAQPKTETINLYLKFEGYHKTNFNRPSIYSFNFIEPNYLKIVDSIKYKDNQTTLKLINSKIDTLFHSDLEFFTFSKSAKNTTINQKESKIIINNTNEISVINSFGNQIKYVSSYLINSLFDNTKIISNTYFAMRSNLFGKPYCKKSNTEILKYDIVQNTWEEILLPDPIGIEMAYFQPKRLLDTDGKYFYVADVFQYKINIYNLEGTLIDQIVYNDKIFDNSVISTTDAEKIQQLTKKNRNNPALVIDSLLSYNTKFNIYKIDAVNDSVLLVLWGIPKNQTGLDFYFDFWKKQPDNNWKLKKRLTTYEIDKSSKESLNSKNFTDLFIDYTCHNNKIIFQTALPVNPQKYFDSGITCMDFNKLNEEHFKKNDVTWNLMVYDLSKLLKEL